jgi:ATP-dependent Clp protease ATP-binding subunit ClpA
VFPFRPLPPPAHEAIVELELKKLRERPGFVERYLRLELSPRARSRLAELGHDAKLGARPLRRTIEDLIVAPLAERMARDPGWRDVTVRIGVTGEPSDIVV